MGEVEFNQETTPYECRLGWTVDLDKFDFQGRAALEALKEKPRTRIVTVVGAPKEADISGLELTVDSTAVGVITMALPSFALEGKTLGFASVNADKAKVGTELEVVGQDGFTVVIVKTPVYDPDKIRVRS